MTKPIEPVACPFCGSKSAGLAYNGQPAINMFMYCTECHSRGPVDKANRTGSGMFNGGEAAASALGLWNRRTAADLEAAKMQAREETRTEMALDLKAAWETVRVTHKAYEAERALRIAMEEACAVATRQLTERAMKEKK